MVDRSKSFAFTVIEASATFRIQAGGSMLNRAGERTREELVQCGTAVAASHFRQGKYVRNWTDKSRFVTGP
jgi:hypothetical protein